MDETRYAVKVTFHKHGDMRYFSQLDLVKVLERALRRTSLPLYFTKGFNPHVKMSFSDALKLGKEGEVSVVFYFTERVAPSTIKEDVSAQLPESFEIIRCVELEKR